MSPLEIPTRLMNVMIALAGYPAGATLDQTLAALDDAPHKRTLQRWLASLVAHRHVVVLGRGKATTYRNRALAHLQARSPAPGELHAREGFEAPVPLSEEGREILAYVRRPRAGREPTGYDDGFLAAYAPNQTFYLGRSARNHLHRIGATDHARRPAGTHGRAIVNRLLIDLSWASSRLEGNTYSRLDTVNLIEFGRRAEGKDALEAQMILNHKAAIELLVDDTGLLAFDRHTILGLHGLLSENLLPDADASGRLRRRVVEITGSVFRPLAVPQAIEAYFDEILAKAAAIDDPFEQAFFVLVQLPYLQPFEDVNKRVSRLAANLPLIRHNLCPLTFIDVPERDYVDATLGVYEMQRVELLRDLFIWAYERSTREYLQVRKTLAEPDPLRLAYRQQLHQLVADVVRAPGGNVLKLIRDHARQHVARADRKGFEEMAQDDIKRLHEGVLARYRLRPAEFAAWQKARKLR